VKKLVNVIQKYAWGSLTSIPELLGQVPSGNPQAELWMGAHPLASSKFEATLEPLNLAIAANPMSVLGARVVEQFGPQLPYLLKVLAAKEPLSLQAHPSKAQAEIGFTDENARDIPLSDSNRNFKDNNHKPELIVAHSPFVALCGFRPVSASVQLLESAAPALAHLLKEQGLGRFVASVLERKCDHLLPQLHHGLASAISGFELDVHWANVIRAKYPNDSGLIVSLLLNCVELQPQQGLFLGAGNLHAYLQGTGIELMANSDNVLRGGLTAKHVDVPQLLSVLLFEDTLPKIIGPNKSGVFETPVNDFRLSIVQLHGPEMKFKRVGPEILLVTDGMIEGPVSLKKGESVFVPFSDGDYVLTGNGTLYRAEVGLQER
jgi:mannose-6-phosphate isomerase